jgi:hypothetical protein
MAQSNRVVDIHSVHMTSGDDGMTVHLEVVAPREHSCHEIDLLVRIARDGDSSRATLLKDLSRLDTQWQRAVLGELSDETITMAPTELSSMRPDKEVAIQEYRDRLYLRFRMSQSISAGDRLKLSIGPLAYEDSGEDNPLQASAMAIGYVLSPIHVADFDAIASSGPIGLLALLRSVGLEGDAATRRVRIQALRSQEGFPNALKKSVRGELLEGHNANLNELATAARLRVFALLDSASFGRFVPLVLSSPHRKGLAVPLGRIWTKLQREDPFSWEAMSFLVPANDPIDSVLAVLGAGVEDMKEEDVIGLLDATQAHQSFPPDSTQVFLEAAGVAWLQGASNWDDQTFKRVLGILEERQVASAVVGFFGDRVWDRLGRLFPGDDLFQLAKTMTEKTMPVQLVRAMGDSDLARREFAFDLVVDRQKVSRGVVTAELARLGHPLAQFDPPEESTDPYAKEWPLTLQGLYLAPLAHPYVEEAERVLYLRRLGKRGSCYDPLQRGRIEVHPRLGYPVQMWARCRAEGAHELLLSGETDAAVTLLESAVTDAGDDPEVRRWVMPVMLGKVRQFVADGQLLEARRMLGRIDPENQHGGARSLLHQIETLRQPKVERSRKHALLLKIFAIFLMVLGVGATIGRWLALRRATRFVNDLSEDKPLEFRSGHRSYLVTDHALLVRRGMVRRLIPWAEIREVCRVPPSTGIGEGLLFWFTSGDGFLVSVGRLSDSGTFIEAVHRYLQELSVPLVEAESMDDVATAENQFMMRALMKRDRMRSIAQAIGLGLGVLATVFVWFAYTDVATISFGQWGQAIAVGLGASLTSLSAIDILIPLSKV